MADRIAGLPIVDGLSLPEPVRRALKPGEVVADREGCPHVLPRYFLEVDSWETARSVVLAPDFGLYEFINTDVREAEALRSFPRYVPLAVLHVAAHLALLRKHVGTFVHVAANGGYRSPSHGGSTQASVHGWGTAANIYRIGDDRFGDETTLSRYADIVAEVLPGAWIRPYGAAPGETLDHLHLDLGRYEATPRSAGTDPDA